MTTFLPGEITSQLNFAVQQKAVAQKYNLRYVTYEAGEGVILANNVPLLQQIERDPRMYDLYKSFISQWQSQIGDTLTLFTLHAPITQYGGFGMFEYIGQPLSQAPKMQAVREFLGVSTTTASTDPTPTTSPTITCPDGTVVLSTTTCPTPTTTSTGPTSPGKRTGSTKGGGKGTKTGTAVA